MSTLKQKGYEAEKLVASHYQAQGRNMKEQNWTIPGGELDVILEKGGEYRFVEVKCVDSIEQLENYIWKAKIRTLKRTIETYLDKNNIEPEFSLDIAYVQNGKILEIYENISNN